MAAAEGNAPEELILAVALNGMMVSDNETVLRLDDRFLVTERLASELNLRTLSAAVTHDRQRWIIPAAATRIDQPRQILLIEAAPSDFRSSVVTAPDRHSAGETDDTPGVYVNYDAVVERGPGLRNDGAVAEFNGFGPFGLVSQSGLVSRTDRDRQVRRLETSWTLDDPPSLRRLRVGDAISSTGSWGRAFRFGGARIGRAFDTAPGFVTMPTAALSGEAELPSTVQVYVNDALSYRGEVPAGPFTIDHIPVVTGTGTLRMVVRDLLGRERLIEAPFYASPSLLRQGLDDWSVEGGANRRAFGLREDHYGSGFGAGGYRFGLTDRLTLEGRAEAGTGRQALGGGLTFGSWAGTGSLALAGSRGPTGGGVMAVAGWDHIGRQVSFGAHLELSSPDFTQLGFEGARPIREQSQFRTGLAIGRYGSVTAALARLRYWVDQADTSVYSLSHSLQLAESGAALITGATLTVPETGRRNAWFGISLVVPLGERTSASIGMTRSSHDSHPRSTVAVQRSAGMVDDWGARASVTRAEVARSTLGVIGNFSGASLAADAVSERDEESVRLQAQGALGLAAGKPFLARRIDESFAVVETAGIPDVDVLLDNRYAGTTDSDGVAVITGLRAYDGNRVAIDPLSLPGDTVVQTPDRMVAPRRGAMAAVRFALHRSRSRLVRLMLTNGQSVPAGATVRMDGRPMPLPVGYDGEWMAEDAAAGLLEAAWPGGQCQVQLPADGVGVLPCAMR